MSLCVEHVRPSWAWRPHAVHHTATDDFFSDGDALCQQNTRQLVVQPPQTDDLDDPAISSFRCQAIDCRAVFTSIADYESHYNSQHRHPCMECRRSLPNSYLLDLHITEWHNPMFDLLSCTQNMYRCLLESCQESFPTYQLRRDHMIKIHKYPANFRFEKPPKDKKQTNVQKAKNRVRTASNVMDTGEPTRKAPMSLATLAKGCIPQKETKYTNDSMETEETIGAAMDVGVVATETQTTDRKFVYKSSVPRTICFGAGSQRGFSRGRGKGRGRHWHQTDKNTQKHIEDVNMADLGEALDTT